MRKWPRTSILFNASVATSILAGSSVVLPQAQAIVLVPSSQYRMSLSPTFGIMTMDSVNILQAAMESILMETTMALDADERESLRPLGIDVIIQAHKLGTMNGVVAAAPNTSFDLPTTMVTFAVLGNFDQVSAATDAKFMDALVSQAFTRAVYREAFIQLLKGSSDQTLMHVIDASVEKLDQESQMVSPVVDGKDPTSSSGKTNRHSLTPVDITLIAVSSLIFVAIVLAILQARKQKKTKTAPRPRKTSSPAVKKQLSVPSYDERSVTSSQVAHLQFVPDATSSDSLPDQASLDTHFRILDHSPPMTPNGGILDEEEGSAFSSPPTRNDAKSMEPTTPTSLPGAVPSSGGSSSNSSSASGVLPAGSLGSLSGHFSSSKWFEGSQNSFSVDSQDVFGVGSCAGKPDDCSKSSKTIDSANATSLAEWAKTIRVIPSDNPSVATPASAPEHDFYNACDDSVDGFATI